MVGTSQPRGSHRASAFGKCCFSPPRGSARVAGAGSRFQTALPTDGRVYIQPFWDLLAAGSLDPGGKVQFPPGRAEAKVTCTQELMQLLATSSRRNRNQGLGNSDPAFLPRINSLGQTPGGTQASPFPHLFFSMILLYE